MDYKIIGKELIVIGERINERLIIPEGQDPEAWASQYVDQLVDVAQAAPESYLYAHVEMAGGDEMDPAGIEINTASDLDVTITIRATENPASPVIKQFSGKWRVTLRNADGGIYDIVGLNFVEGVVTASYSAARAAKRGPAIVEMLERDLVPVEFGGVEYRFRLVGSTTFKVYEDA